MSHQDIVEDLPFKLGQLDHVVLRTINVQTMLDFYAALGCNVVRSSEKLGMHQLRAGSSMIDIVDAGGALGKQRGGAPAPDGPNMDHFALRIDPFDAVAMKAYFNERGIKFVELPMPLFGAEGFGPSVYVTDPDGNTVELKGPPDPEQPKDATALAPQGT